MAGTATASAAAKTRPAPKDDRRLSVEARLARKLAAARKARSVIRFFSTHRWLLLSKEDGAIARRALARAERRLVRATKTIAALRAVVRRREARRRANAPPRVAICAVFGRRYCRQALAVAWCESRHSTTAQNGQYLGLFQMGWYARQLFGHGPTAHQQALAAHRYFVVSGRDWSPWSCKPSYGW